MRVGILSYVTMKALYKLRREFLWRVEDFTDTKGMFYYGKYIVRYWIIGGEPKVEVYNTKKDYYLVNIEHYLEQCYETPREESVWSINGFRDEADYIRYKFG